MPGILRKTRAYLEFTLRPPGYFVDFLNFASDFAPDQLSDSGKLASFQNGVPNTRSVFSGNFRKRKVLGTLCFPFCLPENLVQAKYTDTLQTFCTLLSGYRRDAVVSQPLLRQPPAEAERVA